MRTTDGRVYYQNSYTGVTQWEVPSDYQGQGSVCRVITADSPKSDWCWMEDETEVFVPARLKGRYSNKIEFQLMSGETRYKPDKNYNHIPLQLDSLSKRVDDLVLLDDLNVPLILHQLKERCKQDQIYVRFRLLQFYFKRPTWEQF
jgi:myosin heavy subunit